jgi:phosphoribosylformylglycinamidine synthase
MASVIDLAIRRIIAVGGKMDMIAGLDNFCWPDPVQSEKTPDGTYKLAQLVRANQALYNYTKAFKVPCISGKDSMKNDSTRGSRKISIPPTVLFSAISKMDDISKAVSLDAKFAGDLVYVIGNTANELGGSEYYAMFDAVGNKVPKVDAQYAKKVYQAVSKITEAELAHSLHTPALGGLGVAFAKTAMGGRLGLKIDLDKVPLSEPCSAAQILYSESNTRFLMTVSPENAEKAEKLLTGIPFAKVGEVTTEPVLEISGTSIETGKIKLDKLVKAYKDTLDHI